MSTLEDTYRIDTAEAVASLKALSSSVKQVKEEVDTGIPSFKKMADQWREDVAHGFLTASAQFEIAKRAIEGLVDVVKEGLKGWVDEEKALSRLTQVLKNAGVDSEVWTKRLKEQAEILEATTGAESTHTLALQAMLVTMGIAPREIERFTVASVKLAATMNTDSVSAARLLARAHEDGREELKKYGITISDAAANAKGFEGVLLEVEHQTKGVNENLPAFIEYSNQLGHSWDELKKSVGGGVAELVAFLNSDTIARNREILRQQQAVRDAVALGEKIKADNLLKYGKMDVSVGAVSEYTPSKEEKAAYDKQVKDYEEMRQRKLVAQVRADAEERDLRDAQEKKDQEYNAKEFMSFEEMDKKRVKNAEETQKLLADLSQAEVGAEMERIQIGLAAEDKAATEEAELANQKAEEIRAIQNQLGQDLKGYGQQLVGFFSSMISESVQQNTRFNRAVKEMSIERQLVGLNEQQAAQKRLSIEKQMADEEKAGFQKRLAAFLANISGQAAGKAIFEAAEAIASAASYQYQAAALHAAAAAAFGAIAGVTGGAAAGISANRGLTTDERQQLEDAQASATDRAAREKKQSALAAGAEGTGTVVNVFNIGIAGATELEQAQELERIRKQYDDTKTGK